MLYFLPVFLLACFKNNIFTKIRNGSLRWVITIKNVKKTQIQKKI